MRLTAVLASSLLLGWTTRKFLREASTCPPGSDRRTHDNTALRTTNESLHESARQRTETQVCISAQLPVLAHSMIRALCTLCLTFRSVGQANGRNFELRRSAVLLRRANRWHARYVMSHSRYDGIAMRSKDGFWVRGSLALNSQWDASCSSCTAAKCPEWLIISGKSRLERTHQVRSVVVICVSCAFLCLGSPGALSERCVVLTFGPGSIGRCALVRTASDTVTRRCTTGVAHFTASPRAAWCTAGISPAASEGAPTATGPRMTPSARSTRRCRLGCCAW